MLSIIKPTKNTYLLWQGLCLVTAIVAGVFYALTLHQAHDWGGDFSQYIMHARNLAEGLPYKETGHLQNPELTIAPEVYPVVFPLLLVPIYVTFGLNLLAYKVVAVLCFTGFLLMLWPVFRPHLPPQVIFFITVLIAFNPGFYLFKEYILSELTFVFFLFVCFYFMHKSLYARKLKASWIFYGLVGLGLFLAIGTRSAGMVLIPAWVGAAILRKEKQPNWLVLLGFSLLIFLGLYFLQSLYMNSQGESYLDQFRKMYTPDMISTNLVSYFNEAKLLWAEGANRNFKLILLSLLLLLSAVGLGIRLIKRQIGVFELFLLGTLFLTMIWPWYQAFRMLTPIIPLLFFYAFYAVNAGFNWRPNVAFSISGVLFLLWLVPYFKSYWHLEAKMPADFLRKDTKEMFAFIRETPPQARVMFVKPRVLALYTGHQAMVSYCPENPETFLDFLKTHQLDYLVIPKKEFDVEVGCLKKWVKLHPEAMQLHFSNEGFWVYKLLP